MPTEELRIELPFAGFYETALGDAPNREAESIAENQCDSDIEEQETAINTLLDGFNSSAWRGRVGAIATQETENLLIRVIGKHTATGGKVGLRYEEITSPSEYNFDTDRLYATTPAAVAYALLTHVLDTDRAALAENVRAVGTEQPGYMPLVSPDLADWLEEPLESWGAARLGLLLHTALSIEFTGDYRESLDSETEWKAQEIAGDYMPFLPDIDE